MGNKLGAYFVYEGGADTLSQRLNLDFLEKLLVTVAGDVCSRSDIERFSQKILESEIPTGEQGSGVEIQVGNTYWFGVSAFYSNGVYISLHIEDVFFYNYDKSAESVMSDFAKRVRKAFEFLKPWYGYAETDESIDAVWEAYGARFKPDAHVCWLNYYSPSLAAELGRDKLLSAAKKTQQELGDVTIDELADGAISLRIGKMPGYIENIPKFKAIEKELFSKPCKYDAKRV